MSKIGVIGAGAWGSALAAHCSRIGHEVAIWKRDCSITSLSESEFLIVALPAQSYSEVLPELIKHTRPDATIVSATKGIEPSTGTTPLNYFSSCLGIDEARLCVISGPSFASDVLRGSPVSLVAAAREPATSERIAEMLGSDTLRLYTSSDPLGVELGGICKNVIAIAAGVSDSLGFGPSARSGLITRGLAEMTRLAIATGADGRTLTGLSGLGDLIMTATDNQSRNRQVGLRLGLGESITEISRTLGSTAEGVGTAPLILKLGAQFQAELPITQQVAGLINGTLKLADIKKNLMSRPRKREF